MRLFCWLATWYFFVWKSTKEGSWIESYKIQALSLVNRVQWYICDWLTKVKQIYKPSCRWLEIKLILPILVLLSVNHSVSKSSEQFCDHFCLKDSEVFHYFRACDHFYKNVEKIDKCEGNELPRLVIFSFIHVSCWWLLLTIFDSNHKFKIGDKIFKSSKNE